MIVKHLDDVIGTKDDVDTEGWNSRRLIFKDAGVGYSVNDTVIKAGA
jgi:L-ectoine synthase